MGPIISILVEQQPSKIGTFERSCVQDSLFLAVQIVALDLQIQLERAAGAGQNEGSGNNGGEQNEGNDDNNDNSSDNNSNNKSVLLSTLQLAFDKKKQFYKGSKGQWNVNHMHGLPEVRIKTIAKFKSSQGFVLLNKYIRLKASTSKSKSATADPSGEFPNLETLRSNCASTSPYSYSICLNFLKHIRP